MNYKRTNQEFASDFVLCRSKPIDIVQAIRSDTVQAVFEALLTTKRSTKIKTETHTINITVRKNRTK